MDLEAILKHTNDVKEIILAVVSEENQERFAEIKEHGETIIDLVFAILREPLAIKGIELERSRGIIDVDMLEEVVKRIEKRQEIIPYEPEE